jgi:dTMP kinase
MAANKAMSRGAFVLFEGVDRCGKTTQATKLVESLNNSNVKAELWRYPDRTTTIGKMIDDYLQKKSDSDDASMHLLFAANRWEKKKMMEEKLSAGVTLVVDRYGYSGVAFTTAKRLPGLDQQWCKHSETGLVKPDCLMYMEISEEAAKKRGGYGEERYETTEMQRNVREVFSDLREDWWSIVDADRSIEQVQVDVEKIAREAVERCKNGLTLEYLW